MPEAIEAVENGFKEYLRGKCEAPVRMNVLAPEKGGRYILLPCYLADSGIFHTKIFSVYLDNPKKNLPTNYYYYLLHDADTGEIKAIMGGTYITNLRTGALPGLATRYLARKDSRVFTLFGAGPVAEYQLLGIVTVVKPERINLVDLDQNRATDFARRMETKYGVRLDLAKSVKDAVRESDVITTVTSSTKPVFDGRDVKPGTHINAVGGINPKGSEVDEYIITHSKIVVEKMGEILSEAGEILIPIEKGTLKKEDIHAEIAEVITGKKPGRTSPEEITFFKSIGFAMEDAVMAKLVYQKAVEKGLGQFVEI
jgi:ornithine cyclodeaminase/alanine dehydrogenase-like protein (mu-crystallin family)